MTTATLKRRTRKAKSVARRPLLTQEEDCLESFYMPAFMTLDQFRQWTASDDFPEHGKIEFIGTEIFIDLSAERIIGHGSVKTEACTVLNSLIRKRKSGKFYSDKTRLANPEAEIANEPDAFFAKWETLKNDTLRMIPTADGDDYIELEGTPDWIMEIISPSSVTKDRKTLRERYHRAGIAEYWLIDARGQEVDFDILLHRKDGYERAEKVKGWQMSPTFGKLFRLRRITDPTGEVDYRLQMK